MNQVVDLFKRPIPRWIWPALWAFQLAFGLYYVHTEHLKGAFLDPWLLPVDYFNQHVHGAWKALFPGGDNEAYNRAAYSLLEYGKYIQVGGQPSAWAPIGYPVLLAGIYSVFGYRYLPIPVIHAALLTGALFFLIQICRHFFGNPSSWICLVLLAMNLRAPMFIGYIYTECLFLFLISAIAWLVWVRDGINQPKTTVLIALLGGYALLVRPVFLPLALVLLWRSIRQKKYWAFVIGGLLMAAPTGLWLIRNHQYTGQWVLATSGSNTTAEGNNDFYFSKGFLDIYENAKTQNPHPPLSVEREAELKTLYAQDPELAVSLKRSEQQAIWNAQHTWSQRLWLIAVRSKAILSPFTADMSDRQKLICSLLWLVLFPASLLGVFYSADNSDQIEFAVYGLVLLVLPALVVIGPSLRYQIPTQLLLTPFAAYAYSRFLRRT